jgi:hypothetical protein
MSTATKSGPTYAELAAALEDRRHAEDEKTARLRALRLAKEATDDATEATDEAPTKPQRRATSLKRRKAS